MSCRVVCVSLVMCAAAAQTWHMVRKSNQSVGSAGSEADTSWYLNGYRTTTG